MKRQKLWAAVAGLLVLAGCQFSPFKSAQNSKSDFYDHRIPGLAQQGFTGSTTSWDRANADDSNHSLPAGNQQLAGSSGQDRQSGSLSSFKSVADDLDRGHAEAAQGRLEQAKLSYQRVLEKEPDHLVAHHRLAILADKQQDFRTAEQHYLAALRKNSDDPNLFSDMGYSYFLQGRYLQSEKLFHDALRVQPTHKRALNNLGLLYGTRGKTQADYDQSFAIFRRAGSESGAQSKIAKLFPQGRPTINGAFPHSPGSFAQTPAPYVNQLQAPLPAVASAQQSPAVGPNPFAANSIAVGANVNTGGSPNEINYWIKQSMERARLESIAQRKMKQALYAQSNAARMANPSSVSAGNPALTPGVGNPAFGQPAYQNLQSQQIHPGFPQIQPNQARSNNVSDGQLNAVFAGIDDQNGLPAQQASSQAGTWGTPGTSPPAYQAGLPSRDLSSGVQAPMVHHQLPTWPASPPPSQAVSDPKTPLTWPTTYPSTSQTQTIAGTRQEIQSAGFQRAGFQRQPLESMPTSFGRQRQDYSQNGAVNDAKQAAAIMGMNAGPGGLFPMMQNNPGLISPAAARILTGSGSRITGSRSQFPLRFPSGGVNAAGMQTDPLQQYEAQIRRHNAEINQLTQKLQSAQRLPSEAGSRSFQSLQSQPQQYQPSQYQPPQYQPSQYQPSQFNSQPSPQMQFTPQGFNR